MKNDLFGILTDLSTEVFFMWNLTFQIEPDSCNFGPASDFRYALPRWGN